MAVRFDLTLDSRDAERLAAFWRTALGYVDEPPPPPFATREEWVASFGELGDEGGGAWLCDPDGIGPRLSILEVPEPKTAKNRLHLDIRLPHPENDPDARWERICAEATRLVAAGGQVLHEVERHHVVMSDPEGNEFCVT